MNLLTLVKEKVNKAYAAQGYANANTLVKTSDRPDISDYQSNGALPLAKETKENPRAIAEKIVQELKKDSFFSDVRIDGPGFINMRIADTVLGEMPYDILSGKSCGYERKDAPRKIFIDYGGPNIAKALHVGHLRPAVIGEAIKRLCQFVGDEVIGDVHLGDFGLPMGLVATELMERKPDLPYFDPGFTGEYPKESPVTLAELGILYPLASQKSKEDPTFMAKAKENTRKFQTGDRGLGALVAHFVNVSVSEIKSLYDELDVYFDLWRGESHVLVRLQNMIERLRKNGTIIPDSGAEIIPLGKSKGGNDLPPLIMVSSDKTMMYGATDLATIEERVEEFHPDNILYVVDARQALHFEQVFSGAEKIGLGDAAKLEFLGFGTINGSDNKPFKTRDGGVVTLRVLIDMAVDAAKTKMNAGEIGRDLAETEKNEIAGIVGVSALKFADLMNERMKNYIFEAEKLTSVEGKTGPYILYAIVRMKSILEKMDTTAVMTAKDVIHITHPAERALLLRLYALPDSVQTAYDNRTPHVICDYLFKLMQDFNLFYHDCPIKDADAKTKASRLALVKYTLHVAQAMAGILGLKIPNKM